MVNWILVELENDICFLFFGYWVFQRKIVLFFHMRYRLFLHYGWFLQNPAQGFIRTNMHTTTVHTCYLAEFLFLASPLSFEVGILFL